MTDRPGGMLIGAYRRRLGDILLEHRRLNPDTLSRALAEQERVGKRLGELLVAQGAVDKAAVAAALRELPQAVAAGRTPRLGAVLLGLGLVPTDELVEALRVQYHTGKALGQILHRESAVGW